MPATAVYPQEWPIIAYNLKQERGWQCEKCHIQQGEDPHNNITVHHRDHNPFNCDPSNLLVVCQVCHLRLEAIYRHNNHSNAAFTNALSQGQLMLPTFSKLFYPQLNKDSYASSVLVREPGV